MLVELLFRSRLTRYVIELLLSILTLLFYMSLVMLTGFQAIFIQAWTRLQPTLSKCTIFVSITRKVNNMIKELILGVLDAIMTLTKSKRTRESELVKYFEKKKAARDAKKSK